MNFLASNYRTKNITINSSRPLAAQFFFGGHFLSKFSVFAESILYLPAATEFGVMFSRMLGYDPQRTKKLVDLVAVTSEFFTGKKQDINYPIQYYYQYKHCWDSDNV